MTDIQTVSVVVVATSVVVAAITTMIQSRKAERKDLKVFPLCFVFMTTTLLAVVYRRT